MTLIPHIWDFLIPAEGSDFIPRVKKAFETSETAATNVILHYQAEWF